MSNPTRIVARIFAIPPEGRFALAKRGVVKVWTRESEARMALALSAFCDQHDQLQGLAEIAVQLEADGSLKVLNLDRGSGSALLDTACLEVLKTVSPLPVPPAVVLESSVVIQLEINAASVSASAA